MGAFALNAVKLEEHVDCPDKLSYLLIDTLGTTRENPIHRLSHVEMPANLNYIRTHHEIFRAREIFVSTNIQGQYPLKFGITFSALASPIHLKHSMNVMGGYSNRVDQKS
jgi:hypothetical protein